MTRSVQELLKAFDQLPDPEKREATTEILRRVRRYDSGAVADDALILSAEELFLELDQREAIDERP